MAEQIDEPLTWEQLVEDIEHLDSTLRELRRRADDRDVQYQAMMSIGYFAEVKLPSGLGNSIDKALITPKAGAIMLHRSLQRAQKSVPTTPAQLDEVIAAANRLLAALPTIRAEVALGRALQT